MGDYDETTECECGQAFATWVAWHKHSQRPTGYEPPGPGLHRRILRPATEGGTDRG